MKINPIINCETFSNVSHLLGMQSSRAATQMLDQYCASKGGGTKFAEYSNPLVQNHLNRFYEQIMEPERKMNKKIQYKLSISRMDGIKYVTSVAELESGIPVSMHEAILTYAPVRKLFEAGMITGFGVNIDELPPEDRWGRLINNGRVDVDSDEIKVGDVLSFTYDFYEDDPTPTLEEKRAVEATREWLDSFLENTKYDPTNYPNRIGKLKNKK